MKTDRLFVTRAAAVLLMSLLLGAGTPAGGVKVTLQLSHGNSVQLIKWGKTEETGVKTGLPTTGGDEKASYKFGKDHEVKRIEVAEIGAAAVLAKAIAKQVQQVHERFTANRKALRILSGPGNAPGYLSNEVTGLIADTHQDLDQAIQNVQPSGTEPLRAWVDDQFQQIQGKVPPPGPVASLPGPSAPRAGAVLASLRGGGLAVLAEAKPKKPAPPKAAPPPKPQTIPTATADRLLDQVEEVVSRIFTLADHNDLEVSLWVGGTSVRKAKLKFWSVSHGTFRFWPEGNIKGSPPAPTIIQMDGKKDHILRGLYSYQADLGLEKGAVIQTIKYPNSAAPLAGERLDLVKGSRFFCCQFNEDYCHHVDSEKDCR
jgi:hypothetical protein